MHVYAVDVSTQLPPFWQGHDPHTVFEVALHAARRRRLAGQVEHNEHTRPTTFDPETYDPLGHCEAGTHEPLYKYWELVQVKQANEELHVRQLLGQVVLHVMALTKGELTLHVPLERIRIPEGILMAQRLLMVPWTRGPLE